jgi:hypothetical protein
MLTQPSLPQRKRAPLLTPSLRIDDFVEFQKMFLRMNRQMDAGEWPSFDQKRLSRFGPGISFCMLNRPNLPQPKRAASLMPSLRIDDFVEFQKMLLRMNRVRNAFLRMNEARQMTENGL